MRLMIKPSAHHSSEREQLSPQHLLFLVLAVTKVKDKACSWPFQASCLHCNVFSGAPFLVKLPGNFLKLTRLEEAGEVSTAKHLCEVGNRLQQETDFPQDFPSTFWRRGNKRMFFFFVFPLEESLLRITPVASPFQTCFQNRIGRISPLKLFYLRTEQNYFLSNNPRICI